MRQASSVFTRRYLFGALGGLLSSLCLGALAQTWPSGPIKIIVPYPPGGSSDIIARAISQPLSEALKQTVVVENRPGANGNLGADVVAKSKPDGLTLLLCDTGALAISPSVYTKLAFDPSTDLRGVSMLAYSPHMLVVHQLTRLDGCCQLPLPQPIADFHHQECCHQGACESPSQGF